MIQDRTCRGCSVVFLGGPRAYYCPDCREVRKRKSGAAYQRRRRAGDAIRKIGSSDTCERCKKTYTVKSGVQRFCPECQPIHAADHDRKTSLAYYHKHKDRINPPRNAKRRGKKDPTSTNR